MDALHEIPAAVIQDAPVFMNLALTLDKTERLVKEAASQGARLVVFPETWLPGYPVWLDYAPNAGLWDHPPAKAVFRILSENAPAIPGPHFERLKTIAADHKVFLVVGLHERSGGTLYNTMLFLDGESAAWQIHRKLVPTYTERLIWGRGDGSTLAAMPLGSATVGGLICWEHWMPLARAAMHAKQETIHVAQWSAVNEIHQVASRHYAFEGRCFVLAAGSVLSKAAMLEGLQSHGKTQVADALPLFNEIPVQDDELLLRGGSCIIGPDGHYHHAPVQDEARILYANLDPRLVKEARMLLDTDGHYARPDVFKLSVNTMPQTSVLFETEQ